MVNMTSLLIEQQIKSIEKEMREVRKRYKGVKRVSFMNRTTPMIADGQAFDSEMSLLEIGRERLRKQLAHYRLVERLKT
jgi:hypothetical protein